MCIVKIIGMACNDRDINMSILWKTNELRNETIANDMAPFEMT